MAVPGACCGRACAAAPCEARLHSKELYIALFQGKREERPALRNGQRASDGLRAALRESRCDRDARVLGLQATHTAAFTAATFSASTLTSPPPPLAPPLHRRRNHDHTLPFSIDFLVRHRQCENPHRMPWAALAALAISRARYLAQPSMHGHVRGPTLSWNFLLELMPRKRRRMPSTRLFRRESFERILPSELPRERTFGD